MTTRFRIKEPRETVTLGFDFKDAGQPLNPTVEISVAVGTDPNPSAVLIGSPFISGTQVFQRATGGLDLCDYAIVCFADVGSDRLNVDTILPVRARPLTQ